MSDLIRREDVIEAIKLYFTDIISNMPCDNKHNIIDTALAENYLEVNKGLLGEIREIPNAETTGALDDAIQEYIKDGYILAEPKVGKWEECKVVDIEDTTITEIQSAYCPICHKYHTTPYMYYFDYFNYCPNCGAKMERSES